MHRVIAASLMCVFIGCGSDMTTMPPAPPGAPSPVLPPRPVNLSLTFTADKSCTQLPSIARSRTYTAVVEAGAPFFNLDGGMFGQSSEAGYPSLWNVVYQKAVDNGVNWSFQDPEVWEQLSKESYVVLFGGPVRISLNPGTGEPQTGDFSFWGRFTYCAEREPDSYPECEASEISCESAAHTLTIVRQ
jgi:hypothetical protein